MRAHVLMASVVLLLICSLCMFTIVLEVNGQQPQRRRLIYIPPEAGEGTDYSSILYFGKRFAGTTSKSVVEFITNKLRGLDGGAFVNITSKNPDLGPLVRKAASSLANSSGGWDESLKAYRRSGFQAELDAGINGRVTDPLDRNNLRNTTEAVAEEGPESLPYAWLKHEERPLHDLFDIVIATGNLTVATDFTEWTTFLEAWKPVIEKINLIIIQQGDPRAFLPLPDWVHFELYTREDVAKALGEHAWIIDMDSDGPSARSFGLMAADKEFVWFLDRHMRPARDAAGKIINPLAAHVLTLATPSTPYYYNTHYDPFHKTSDFSRAYPPSLRDGVPTALSLGPVLEFVEYDSVTRAFKPNEREQRRPDVAQTIPHGVLFSLSTNNLAVNRFIMGPALYFPSSILAEAAGFDVGDRNLEVITGWIAKVAADWVRTGCKHGGESYVSMLPPSPKHMLTDVAFDVNFAVSTANSEALVRFFSAVELHVAGKGGASHDSISAAIHDVLGKLEEKFGGSMLFFKKYCKAFRAFMGLWADQHAFHPKPSVLPVASRATMAPPPNSPHRCAAFTIMHDEAYMLPIWVRYYRRHFPGSVFVIDHQRNYTSLPPEVRRAQEVNVSSLQGPGGGSDALVRYIKLFGDQKGFPVHYFVAVAQLWMGRLLRVGYTCVVYTDVDEMLVTPNKAKYPRGLIDLVIEFVKNPAVQHFRGMGHNVAHVSESEDATPPLEAALNWSAPLLAQRSYWVKNARYDKPLLSKVPLRWRPGFHMTFLPPPILHHEHMFLLHLPEIDKAFCLEREAKKHAAMMIAHDWERGGGWNSHIARMPEAAASGKLCRYARGVFVKKRNVVLDNTGQEVIGKMPAEFAEIDI